MTRFWARIEQITFSTPSECSMCYARLATWVRQSYFGTLKYEIILWRSALFLFNKEFCEIMTLCNLVELHQHTCRLLSLTRSENYGCRTNQDVNSVFFNFYQLLTHFQRKNPKNWVYSYLHSSILKISSPYRGL